MDRRRMAYWEALSSSWQPQPPLCPVAEDLRFFERVASEADVAAGGDAPRALLLGVTAGIATMRWPAGTRLLAVDWAAGIIERSWPRAGTPPGAAVLRADWRELPLPPGAIDFALGDGCYTALGTHVDAALFNREMRRVLRPGGLLALRCFCRPAVPLDVDQLFDELFGGRFANLDLFRWLLTMAVQGAAADGVDLRAVWEAWHARVPDAAALAAQLGFPAQQVANIERWRGVDGRYAFASLAELEALAAADFELLACAAPGYDFGACFPHLVLRARG
ncbi:MAG: class I SAM-dependent methyltransferase [Gammaproteobacteria bacterium]